jgi:hypothetical protein
MSTENILLTKNIEPNLIKLGDQKGNYINVYYPDESETEYVKFKIQTPKMKIPWVPKEMKSKQGRVFSLNFTVSTDEIGSEKNKSTIELFRNKIYQIESVIKDKLPDEFKQKTFTSSLWQGTNLDYKPTMKLSIPCFKDNIPSVIVYAQDGSELKIEDVTQRSICTFIISIHSVWSNVDKVGLNWNIEQITVWDNRMALKVNTPKTIKMRTESD